jgi:hypothetical protein
MKKKAEKKLALGKIKIANLNQTKGQITFIITHVCTSPSQGAEVCSEDSCRF